jgi:molybdopterin-containing oxidoreductase family membrane subunit
MTFWIINTIIAAYILSTVVFLIVLLFCKKARTRTNIYLNKANLIIVFVLLLNIIWVGQETIECYVASRKESAENIVSSFRHNCFSRFIGTFLFAFIFQAIFFFNRQRTKISLTIVSILMLTVIYNYERIVIFITNLYRDYLPSSWSVYYDNSNIYWTIIATILYFVICWTNYKRKPLKPA